MIPTSVVVNLSNTFGKEEETKRFVTRYIRLTHCDIFFADAVILVEGPAEKILVPSFIKKSGLDSYYISVIEINGRHAHSFRSLIEKLGIATLIVTDIDATEKKLGKNDKEYDSSVITAKGKGYSPMRLRTKLLTDSITVHISIFPRYTVSFGMLSGFIRPI